MKRLSIICGVFLVFAVSAGAQEKYKPMDAERTDSAYLQTFAANAANPFFSPEAALAEAPAEFPEPLPASPEPQKVAGVFPSYRWQVYVGYAYSRFYAYPGATPNENGFDLAAAYYFGPGWLGAEGELTPVFGSLAGKSSSLVFGGGGPKVRWSGPRGVDVWAHAIAGGAHFTPHTPYGGESSFGYELGAGIDIRSRYRRLAYRVEGDMVGTHFFGTFQYSPKISAGVVLNF